MKPYKSRFFGVNSAFFLPGRDHIFVWGSGMAADGPFATWRDWVPNAIFMMTEPELWNPYKEILDPTGRLKVGIFFNEKIFPLEKKSLQDLGARAPNKSFLLIMRFACLGNWCSDSIES
jgi:hypothetical protein